MPVTVVAGQARALESEHDPGLLERHVGDETLEAFAIGGRGAREALVDVDHDHPLPRPAERDCAAAQVILAHGRLTVLDHLTHR